MCYYTCKLIIKICHTALGNCLYLLSDNIKLGIPPLIHEPAYVVELDIRPLIHEAAYVVELGIPPLIHEATYVVELGIPPVIHEPAYVVELGIPPVIHEAAYVVELGIPPLTQEADINCLQHMLNYNKFEFNPFIGNRDNCNEIQTDIDKVIRIYHQPSELRYNIKYIIPLPC